MRLSAFCDFEVLKMLLEPTPIVLDYFDSKIRQNVETHLELIGLLMSGLNITTNTTAERFEEFARSNKNAFYLQKNGQVKFDNPVKAITDEGESYFSRLTCRPHANIVSQTYQSMIGKWGRQSGEFFISSIGESNVLFKNGFAHFDPNAPADWTFAVPYLEPHNAILIADPYIFEGRSLDNLLDLLENNGNVNDLKRPYHLTLVGAGNRKSRESADTYERQLATKFLPKLSRLLPGVRFEYYFVDSREFHDRYLITNNCFIAFGSSLDFISKGQSIHETSCILTRPFKRVSNLSDSAFYAEIMARKIRQLNKWIKRTKSPDSLNPLFSWVNS